MIHVTRMTLVAVLLAAPAAAQTPDAAMIVTRATRVYKALSGLQADFRQRIDDEFLGPVESRGVLYQSGADKFAMRFSDPPTEAIVLDGTRAWVYLPSSIPGQVLRYPASSSRQYGWNVLGWILDRPLERYRVTFQRTEDVGGARTDAVLLDAIAADLPFRRATVWFDRSDGLPRRLEIHERTGKRTIELSRIRTNSSIPASVFTFTPPSGVKVVDQKS